MLAITVLPKSRSASSPTAWPKRSLIDLKWSRSNISTLTGSRCLGLPRDQSLGRFQEAAPIEQAGQFVGRGRVLVDAHDRSLASTSTMNAVPTT